MKVERYKTMITTMAFAVQECCLLVAIHRALSGRIVGGGTLLYSTVVGKTLFHCC